MKQTGTTVSIPRIAIAPALSVAVASLGLLNLWSSLLAKGPGRLEILRDVIHVPLMIEHGSRSLIALFGLCLLMLSRSLARRKRQAWVLTVLLVAASPIFHLVKGLDYEEALICVGLLIALLLFRHEFLAENDVPSARQGLIAGIGLYLFAALYGPIGTMLLRRDFAPTPTPALAINESTHYLMDEPADNVLIAKTGRAKWFEDSLLVMSVFSIGYGTFMLLRPVLPRETVADTERAVARDLLGKSTSSPIAYFCLLDDKRYLFGPAPTAPDWMISYRLSLNHAIALGDPVAPPEHVPSAIAQYVELCRRKDWKVAFYHTTDEYLYVYRRAGFQTLKIGEEAVIDLPNWALKGNKFQVLRTALNRMAREGATCVEYDPLAANAPTLMAEMADISTEWLRMRHGIEKSFALGAFEPDTQLFRDSRFFVLQNANGHIDAFVSWVPIYGQTCQGNTIGWALDLMRRKPTSVNGSMNFLITSALRTFQAEGCITASLGLSPLASNPEGEDEQKTEILSRARDLVFRRFNTFFNFGALWEFKSKFGPTWEPRYLVYQSLADLPATIYAVLHAHAPRRFISMIEHHLPLRKS